MRGHRDLQAWAQGHRQGGCAVARRHRQRGAAASASSLAPRGSVAGTARPAAPAAASARTVAHTRASSQKVPFQQAGRNESVRSSQPLPDAGDQPPADPVPVGPVGWRSVSLDSRDGNPVEARASCGAVPMAATWADASSCPAGHWRTSTGLVRGAAGALQATSRSRMQTTRRCLDPAHGLRRGSFKQTR